MTTQFATINGMTYKVRINETTKIAAISAADWESIIMRADLTDDEVKYYAEGCPMKNDLVLLLRKAY